MLAELLLAVVVSKMVVERVFGEAVSSIDYPFWGSEHRELSWLPAAVSVPILLDTLLAALEVSELAQFVDL